MTYQHHHVAVIIPAYNEEESIVTVITAIHQLDFVDRIIVCDNGSTDGTARKARDAGALVCYQPLRGYGAACLKAVSELENLCSQKPQIVVFVDGDNSVNLKELPQLLAAIQKNHLIIGVRCKELQIKGALTPHQKIGNALVTWVIRRLWHYPVTDLGPFRCIYYEDLCMLNMQDQRYGWTVEMQIRAIQEGMEIVEIPVSSLPRSGKSKISDTVTGTMEVAVDMFAMIFKLYWRPKRDDKNT